MFGYNRSRRGLSRVGAHKLCISRCGGIFLALAGYLLVPAQAAGETVVKFSFDMGSVIQDIVSGLSITAITAAVGYCLVSKYISKLQFSAKMQSYGFVNTSTNKQTRKEMKEMCEKAVKVKIINVSGFHYLNDNEQLLKQALARGLEIQFLAAAPDSRFLTDIEGLEYHTIINGRRMREKEDKIGAEVWALIEKYRAFGMKMRFYSTEYRLPYVLAYYEDGSVKAWLTMTLPPYKSTKAFVLRGRKGGEEDEEAEINFVDMMESNFDTIWNYNSESLEELEERIHG